MDVREQVASAGRAVLDMVEQDWQPLSAAELELRLDQAVEEVLESELLRPSSPAVYLHFPRSSGATAALAGKQNQQQEEEDGEAVQYISELLQSSASTARLAGRARLSLSHTVLLSLSLLSQRVSYRSVSRRFRLEKGNIHRIFFSFCDRISALRGEQVRWPLGEEAAELLFPFSEGTGTPQVLGVLGHTRIPIRLPAGKPDPERKRMRKEAHPDCWLNLELVCSCRGRFLHCVVTRGSEVDRGRRLGERLRRNPELMPAGCCLVARAGYPLTPHVLTPYTGSLAPKQEAFNRALEERCGILDRAVGRLKARFRRLNYLDVGNYERARSVVLTACVLHNALTHTQTHKGWEPQGDAETENNVQQEEEEEEEEEEGVQRRDAVADLLMMKVNSGNS